MKTEEPGTVPAARWGGRLERMAPRLPLAQAVVVILGSTGAAVAYGLVHDQITIRVCPEYFTVTHPRITESRSLTVIALAWGVAATWWVGAALGLLLAVAARMGSEPRVPAGALARPVMTLLTACGALALCAGLAGYLLARGGAIALTGELAANIPEAMHARWMGAWWTHMASYGVGGVGGLVLVGWVLRARWRLR
ncbi:MAG TPA: hypothetical protein VFF69_04925 [Phycisphaerales bacterium]|nr:hypothetical protein [Phycisphaerales bacterium]